MKPVVGIVVSNKMQKSVVVAVDRLFHNKVYNRYVKRTSKFMAHDEAETCNIGDRVRTHDRPVWSRPSWTFFVESSSKSRGFRIGIRDYTVQDFRTESSAIFNLDTMLSPHIFPAYARQVSERDQHGRNRAQLREDEDELIQDSVGTMVVRLDPSRPLSKNKHWIVAEVLRRAKMYVAQPPAAKASGATTQQTSPKSSA
ncbi:30S ribosomal protein S17 [Hordeum vulgare]|nr:30S ribosomal protein S17 [Hordeum vulgare]